MGKNNDSNGNEDDDDDGNNGDWVDDESGKTPGEYDANSYGSLTVAVPWVNIERKSVEFETTSKKMPDIYFFISHYDQLLIFFIA